MNNKKWLVPVAGVAVAAVAYTGTAFWAGKSAEGALERQHKLMADLPYLVVKNRDYQRGLFSSTERTTLTLNPNLLRSTAEAARLAGQELPKLELTYTQHIHHGPFPMLGRGNPTPMKAFVETDIEFSPETQKLLSKFFGDQKPLTIENRIGFNDSGVLSVKVPAFTYEETLAGVKAVWSGFDGNIDYSGDFNHAVMDAKAPGFEFNVKSKGKFNIKNITFHADNTRGIAGLMLGEGKLTLDEVNAQVDEGLPFPLKFSLKQLSYLAKTEAKGEFVNSGASIDLASLVLNDKTYGPARLAVEANHLHAQTIAKLSEEIGKLQRDPKFDAQMEGAKMVEIFKKHGMPLLKNDPQLALKELRVKLPEGEVKLQADLALKGFEEKDLDAPPMLLEKLVANANLSVPKQVIETYVLWQARRMVEAQGDTGANPEDMDALARGLMEGQIRRLKEQSLIKENGGSLETEAHFLKGKLTVNGREIPLPWQAPQPAAEGDAATGDQAAQ